MTEISRTALFGKLNKLTYKTIESATLFCKMRGNPHVEIEHWLHQLLQLQDSDLHRILRHFECDAAKLSRDLLEALDSLPRGATSVADFSAYVEESVERGWVYASLLFNSAEVRSGHWLLGMARTRSLRLNLERISPEFRKVSAETLASQFERILADSPEAGAAGAATPAIAPAGPAREGEALARYTVDLTASARDKKMDPIVGREREIGQIVDILMRRRQNNPILTGEAGVGKTAVVEGLAQRIVAGDVPPPLRDVQLRSLDLGLLQAGASMKGEFEARLKQLIDEVQAAPQPIILFIDEAHTLMGAGGAAGTGDAANMLKPELARGTLRTIAATTWAEYKRHIEKDPALTRRFQVVQVAEPSEAHALEMMRSLAPSLEAHHKVQLLDEALQAAVKLSHRYIPARQLPDKAVSLMDTACARVAISQAASPAPLEAARRRCEALEVERDILLREAATGEDRRERLAAVATQLAAITAERAALAERWQAEQQLVEQILRLRRALQEAASEASTDSNSTSAADSPELAELTRLRAELAELQGEQPLILPRVDAQAVATVVQDWTGIPVGRMVRDEIDTILNLADRLGQRIIGQRHALDMIAKRIETSRAGLDNPDKPIGVFLLAGTSGVGKTETALALAELLYGGEQNLITINMSEYQEAHTVSSLKGAPPGYVGYGEGGVLTEAVRRRPYSVVLLDEVEKAHPDVHEIFFQVFDKGWMEDGEGRRISFKNTLIILTTNAGTDTIARFHGAGEIDPEVLSKALRPPLLQVFPAALLGRLVTIPYFPLSDTMLQAIIRLQLGRIERRLRDNRGVSFSYDDAVVALIGARCTEVESGGRMVDAILTNTVLPAISREFLQRTAAGDLPREVHLRVDDHNFAYDFA